MKGLLFELSRKERIEIRESDHRGEEFEGFSQEFTEFTVLKGELLYNDKEFFVYCIDTFVIEKVSFGEIDETVDDEAGHKDSIGKEFVFSRIENGGELTRVGDDTTETLESGGFSGMNELVNILVAGSGEMTVIDLFSSRNDDHLCGNVDIDELFVACDDFEVHIGFAKLPFSKGFDEFVYNYKPHFQ